MERTIWGIHAGQHGERDRDFVDSNIISIGWGAMGDLSNLKPSRETFKQLLVEIGVDAKPGAIPVYAGILYRFVNEIQVDDYILYPRKSDRTIYLGRVTGPYQFVGNVDIEVRHQRPVEWLKIEVPRTQFSSGALYEFGSAVTLFQIRNHADEVLAVLNDNISSQPSEEVETTGFIVSEIEQFTRDYLMKEIARQLKGHGFALLVADVLKAMGYRTIVSPPGVDQGIDIVAHRDPFCLEPPIIKVQVKSGSGKCGDPEVTQLYGKVDVGEYGLFVTLSGFTEPAKAFCRQKSNLQLVDGEEFLSLFMEHYDNISTHYQSLFPLKRMYLPDIVEED